MISIQFFNLYSSWLCKKISYCMLYSGMPGQQTESQFTVHLVEFQLLLLRNKIYDQYEVWSYFSQLLLKQILCSNFKAACLYNLYFWISANKIPQHIHIHSKQSQSDHFYDDNICIHLFTVEHELSFPKLIGENLESFFLMQYFSISQHLFSVTR